MSDGLHPITAQILSNRGITTSDAIQLFLEAPITALHDPYGLPDMGRAVDRIIQAIRSTEPITIFGDYDTDGACASALMLRFFREINIAATVMLPHRVRDGYGLSAPAVERIISAGGGLLITVDNGTSAHDAVTHAQNAGIDVIITDHHQCKEDLPKAFACVNPHRSDSTYLYQNLCGAGVAFKLLMALRKQLRDDGFFKTAQPNLQHYLPYVAIATIADVMPLTGENRIMVKHGIQILKTHPCTGLAALMRLAEIEPQSLDAESIAFRIAPRLNAAGRMADPEIALQCLASDDAVIAMTAAEQLNRLNGERQASEKKILATLETPELQEKLETVGGIALGDATYPVGVVGIIAGRLARRYRKPAVVVSFENGIGKGSVRSVPGLNVIPILEACAAHLAAFGGHHAAAGVTVTPEQWPAFQAAFAAAAATHLENYQYPAQRIDATVDANALTLDLGRDLKRLAPFGEGNPEPVLAVRPMTVHSRRLVGKNHLKMSIGNTMTTIDAIGFGLWDHPAAQGALNLLVGVPELNTWNGETRIQLRLLDLNPKMDKP
jgi:single-stranded-DNA-specific exonuclease